MPVVATVSYRWSWWYRWVLAWLWQELWWTSSQRIMAPITSLQPSIAPWFSSVVLISSRPAFSRAFPATRPFSLIEKQRGLKLQIALSCVRSIIPKFFMPQKRLAQNSHKKLYASCAGLVLICVAIVVYVFVLHHNPASAQEYPVKGFDVSHHQGDIQWKQ